MPAPTIYNPWVVEFPHPGSRTWPSAQRNALAIQAVCQNEARLEEEIMEYKNYTHRDK